MDTGKLRLASDWSHRHTWQTCDVCRVRETQQGHVEREGSTSGGLWMAVTWAAGP